jgi:hypothetical protein
LVEKKYQYLYAESEPQDACDGDGGADQYSGEGSDMDSAEGLTESDFNEDFDMSSEEGSAESGSDSVVAQ